MATDCFLLLNKPKIYKLSEPLEDILNRRSVVGHVTGNTFDHCLYKLYDKLRESAFKNIGYVCRGTIDQEGIFHPFN